MYTKYLSPARYRFLITLIGCGFLCFITSCSRLTKYGQLDKLESVLKRNGINVNGVHSVCTLDNHRNTFLHVAVKHPYPDALIALLNANDIHVEGVYSKRDNDGDLLVYLLVKCNDPDAIAQLLE